MKITLAFPGFLQINTVESGSTVEVEEGSTVVDLLNAFSISADHQQHIIPIVNQEEKRPDYRLQEGDHLFLYIPVGGG